MPIKQLREHRRCLLVQWPAAGDAQHPDRSPPDGCRLVDPDGYLAEPEYDLGVLMREDPEDLLARDPRDRSRWLAHRCGLDETAIWEWGVVSRLETGLVGTQVGLQPAAGQMLEVADRVAP